ncbi:hypothetical protein [Mycolicibacterium llatzerense]|uniref:hypothetical protein n=1 Tax=Mycolicibacterium llatzerense TaxID=280871 RepID=UPI0021B64A98|nr:hypothetical protein [Mycolicibacterium llatzerense]MCT7366521.1 hypothetical protein [Mycolicibacterium llatzerense]
MTGVRRVARQFWTLLDSENVRLFVWPYYLSLLAWGIYAAAWADAITIVEPEMGHITYVAWIWAHLIGTVSVMTGLVLREGGKTLNEMTAVSLFRDWMGLWLQLGGHVCMGLVLILYETSGIRGAYFGQGVYSLFLVPPYIIGCTFLSLQTGRKLWRAETLNRRLGTDR